MGFVVSDRSEFETQPCKSYVILDRLLLNSIVYKNKVIPISNTSCEDKMKVNFKMKNKNFVVWFYFCKTKTETVEMYIKTSWDLFGSGLRL